MKAVNTIIQRDDIEICCFVLTPSEYKIGIVLNCLITMDIFNRKNNVNTQISFSCTREVIVRLNPCER
ncbi:hypothetical protein AQUCO_05300059v1 [Aquilegia coerulea]|uniref:Uncharacterized protein n=1 Tax=Aquilegia coerulea TaxID=218851 RepID=A0A2G5CI41_AQUCA|nr:hypothetical protein AQUCO_05300059v1 [Aquilegia coerulea]